MAAKLCLALFYFDNSPIMKITGKIILQIAKRFAEKIFGKKSFRIINNRKRERARMLMHHIKCNDEMVKSIWLKNHGKLRAESSQSKKPRKVLEIYKLASDI